MTGTPRIPAGMLGDLQRAFEQRRLTLYLGAGVSVPSGLPNWQRLVLTMYLDLLRTSNQRVYSNYLHAVAEWMLENSPDPLEITAQKIRMHFGDRDDAFIECLRRQLYAGFMTGSQVHTPERRKLRSGNSTLRAVASLCERGAPRAGRGVEAVVTYNYDNLVELALAPRVQRQIVDRADLVRDGALPIYHVHGYVPMEGRGATGASGIIFTEQQYHDATHAAYSWSNLVQIRSLSGSVGLMVGLSLSDRNIRRLLHALSRSPVRASCYALLPRPTWRGPLDHEEQEVHEMAQHIYRQARDSGSPVPEDYGIKGPNWQAQVQQILDRAQDVAIEQQERVLKDLGVTPIWYDDHGQVATLLKQVGA